MTVTFWEPRYIEPQGNRQLVAVFPQIERLFRDFAEQRHIPGLAFGIVVDGTLVYSNAFGVRNVIENALVTPDSIFRIASMTKSLSAMSIIRLRDAGKLRLDDPVTDYVPELATLPYPTTDSAPITIRQLLTMSAGFPQDDPWADRQLALPESQFSEWLSGGISFSNPPGMTFEYSNYGYAILGRVVTTVAGMPYQAYAMRHILAPLGMTSSTYDIQNVSTDRLAMGYRLEAEQWIEEPPLDNGTFGAMGGLFTTIPDFSRYMAFLLSAFPPRNDSEREPLRRSSLREMQQPWRQSVVAASRQTADAPLVIQSDGYGYGLVCGIDSVLGYTVSHGGGLPGYGTFYRLLPDCNIGIVAFTNLTYAAPRNTINDALLLLKSAGVLKPRKLLTSPVLQTTRDRIVTLYEKWDDAEATALSTDSFFQDMPLEKRREQFTQLRTDLGTCISVGEFQAENALRGRWKMICERGSIELFVTLAPTVPPRGQFLQISVAKPLSPELRKAVVNLVRLIQTGDDTKFRQLFSARLKRDRILGQLRAVDAQYGLLTVGDVLECSGILSACIRLVGERGKINVRLGLDQRSGKIREIAFTRPQETPFML